MPAGSWLLCGASNLRFLWPGLARALLADAAGRVHLAAGIGRSYRKTAGLPGLRLSAIGASGAVEAFLADGAACRGALLMDLGNDFFYGYDGAATVSPLLSLAGQCRTRGIPVLVVPPPLAADEIVPWRFALVRRLFYPGCRVEASAVAAALDFSRAALERAAGPGLSLLAPWPVLLPDRIHLAPWHWAEAQRRILAVLAPARVGHVPSGSGQLGELWRTRHCRPLRYMAWGRLRRGRNRLRVGGGEVFLY